MNMGTLFLMEEAYIDIACCLIYIIKYFQIEKKNKNKKNLRSR